MSQPSLVTRIFNNPYMAALGGTLLLALAYILFASRDDFILASIMLYPGLVVFYGALALVLVKAVWHIRTLYKSPVVLTAETRSHLAGRIYVFVGLIMLAASNSLPF